MDGRRRRFCADYLTGIARAALGTYLDEGSLMLLAFLLLLSIFLGSLHISVNLVPGADLVLLRYHIRGPCSLCIGKFGRGICTTSCACCTLILYFMCLLHSLLVKNGVLRREYYIFSSLGRFCFTRSFSQHELTSANVIWCTFVDDMNGFHRRVAHFAVSEAFVRAGGHGSQN